ncbi:MAG: isochorismatase family protein [Nanoarchaeota archaeon]|nr:isochorismatase family protein [Nanoarchaeota archaeon]
MTDAVANQISNGSSSLDSELCKTLEANKHDYAVLIIDVDYYRLWSREDAKKVKNMRNLVSSVYNQKIPIIFSEFGLGTEESLIRAARKPIRFTKSHENAFYNTNLQYILEKLETKEIIVGGFHIAACVYYTSRSAVERGFKVHTSKDILIGGDYGLMHSEIGRFYRNNTNFIEKGNYKSLPIFERDDKK